MTPRRVVVIRSLFLVSAVGFLASATGLIAAYSVAIGATPAWAYGRWPALTVFTTRLRLAGVPVEWFALVFFAAVCWYAAIAQRSSLRHAGAVAVLIGAAIAAGLGLVISTRQAYQSVPFTIATAAACLLVILAAWIELPPLRLLFVELRQETREAVRRPGTRAATAIFLTIAALGAVSLQAAMARVPIDQARARAFRHWYTSQVPAAAPDLHQPGATVVAAFTDYQCSFCATDVSDAAIAIEQRAKAGTAARLVTRDYPLDSSCNPWAGPTQHPLACDMAVAVRLVRAEKGNGEAEALASWLYQQGTAVTRADFERRIATLGLSARFQQRHQELIDLVRRDVAAGHELGVVGTPTFFVDGIKLPGGGLMLNAALDTQIDLSRDARR